MNPFQVSNMSRKIVNPRLNLPYTKTIIDPIPLEKPQVVTSSSELAAVHTSVQNSIGITDRYDCRRILGSKSNSFKGNSDRVNPYKHAELKEIAKELKIKFSAKTVKSDLAQLIREKLRCPKE